MTIDERLDKLTERHEALTQTIELNAIENRERFASIGKFMEELAIAMTRLAHIAEFHDHRIDNHENRLDTLEGES